MFADGSRAAAEAAMRKALSSSAAWRMERTLPGSARTLVSSGTVDCRTGDSGIEWRTEKPFPSLVAMRKDSMVFEDEDGRREKTADEMPRYSDIRKATDAFADGRLEAFDDVFDVETSSTENGGWRAVFRPRISAMRSLVESAEIEGHELPERVTIRSSNGATSTIRFMSTKEASPHSN